MFYQIRKFFMEIVKKIKTIINGVIDFVRKEAKLIVAVIIIILLSIMLISQHYFIRSVTDSLAYLKDENTDLRQMLYVELQEIREKIEPMEEVYLEMHDILYGGKDDPNTVRIESMNDYVRSRSGLTVDEINALLEGTMVEGHGAYFLAAEKRFQTNAWFLLSVSVHETGWWKSNYAINRNNLFGWKAYTHNPDLAQRFDSPGECILHVAERISKLYLQENGKYYRGGTVAAIGYHYATDPGWARGVMKRRQQLEEKLYSTSGYLTT